MTGKDIVLFSGTSKASSVSYYHNTVGGKRLCKIICGYHASFTWPWRTDRFLKRNKREWQKFYLEVRVGLWRKLRAKELMLLNCGVKKTLESSLDCKEIQPVHSKGDQSGAFIGRTDDEAETSVLWPPHAKSWPIGKDPDAGRDLEAGGEGDDRGWDGWMASLAGWHHWLDGRESEWTPGVGDGQGGLVCCDSWGRKESDTTERLNWTETIKMKR